MADFTETDDLRGTSGKWYLDFEDSSDGIPKLYVTCPRCTLIIKIDLKEYSITDDGVLSPCIVCPSRDRRCTFHEHSRLWRPPRKLYEQMSKLAEDHIRRIYKKIMHEQIALWPTYGCPQQYMMHLTPGSKPTIGYGFSNGGTLHVWAEGKSLYLGVVLCNDFVSAWNWASLLQAGMPILNLTPKKRASIFWLPPEGTFYNCCPCTQCGGRMLDASWADFLHNKGYVLKGNFWRLPRKQLAKASKLAKSANL